MYDLREVETGPLCYHCGERCSGETGEEQCVDGFTGWVPVCDPKPDGSAGCGE